MSAQRLKVPETIRRQKVVVIQQASRTAERILFTKDPRNLLMSMDHQDSTTNPKMQVQEGVRHPCNAQRIMVPEMTGHLLTVAILPDKQNKARAIPEAHNHPMTGMIRPEDRNV